MRKKHADSLFLHTDQFCILLCAKICQMKSTDGLRDCYIFNTFDYDIKPINISGCAH